MKSIAPLLIIVVFISVSCTTSDAIIEPTSLPAILDTQTVEPPPESGTILELPTPIVGTVALDFATEPCSASWSNNGRYLPCPSNMEDISNGYANHFEDIIIEGNIHINHPGLLTIPAQPESGYYAIFGKYPPFTIQPGDRFQAVLACANEHSDCDVTFSLEYYSSDNQVVQIPDAKWVKKYNSSNQYIYADVGLDSIAGKTVQLLLAVRDNGSSIDDFAVWIMPHIARLGQAATDAIPPSQLGSSKGDLVSVSGIVDMSTAPPYLFDDHPPGSPAAVVLFDINSAMFYTISTKATHPNFSIDVYPGQYYVLAYSYGIGDVPYVGGSYTGVNPSCGQQMAILDVLPETPVVDVAINDWNWSCGGTADRLEKPEEVSLP